MLKNKLHSYTLTRPGERLLSTMHSFTYKAMCCRGLEKSGHIEEARHLFKRAAKYYKQEAKGLKGTARAEKKKAQSVTLLRLGNTELNLRRFNDAIKRCMG